MSECMTQEDAMNMSDEQAVQILKPLRDMMIDQNGCPISDAVFALDKAIVALKREERKKGKWIHRADMDYKDENGVFHWHGMCGECGFIHDFLDGHISQYNYCPNCGAEMGGETDEQTKN